MKVSRTALILLADLSLTLYAADIGTSVTRQTQQSEIESTFRELTELQTRLSGKIEENRALSAEVKRASDALAREESAFEKRVAEERSSRYQALAKVFEKMEPEIAGEKISKISDAKKAALIIYNMKSRSAGAVMNYVDAKRASTIVTILTDIKRPNSD